MTDLALSLHAPWAWAVMYAGKDVENRGPSFARRRGGELILGRVWIAASLWPGPLRTSRTNISKLVRARGEMIATLREARDWACPIGGEARLMRAHLGSSASCEQLDEMRGHIVGSVEVHGYATPDAPPDSVWYVPGSLGILIRDPRPLARPVPAKGALGWWTPPDDVLSRLDEVIE